MSTGAVPSDPLLAAIEEATVLLSKFSIPLYRKDEGGRPLTVGTGFFVKSGSSQFLVSAAHVFDLAFEHHLFYYSTPTTTRFLSGRLHRSKSAARDSDLIDVGVLELSADSAPPYPEVDKFAMDISYLLPRYRPRTEKDYVFIGFPATKSEVNVERREVMVTPYAFRNEPIKEAEYERHGLNPDDHIALRLDVRKGFGPGGEKQHFPSPHGMSGSPIVVLHSGDGGDSRDVFPVVGVATTYRKHSHLVFGTDIGYVIDAMRHAAEPAK